jgi:hypothetical protein
MSVATGTEVGKDYTSVRISKDLADQARVVAVMRGESLAKFIEGELGPIVRRLDAELSARRAAGQPFRARRRRKVDEPAGGAGEGGEAPDGGTEA